MPKLKIFSEHMFLVTFENNTGEFEHNPQQIQVPVYLPSMDIGDYEQELEVLANDMQNDTGWEFLSAQYMFRQPFIMPVPGWSNDRLTQLLEKFGEDVERFGEHVGKVAL